MGCFYSYEVVLFVLRVYLISLPHQNFLFITTLNTGEKTTFHQQSLFINQIHLNPPESKHCHRSSCELYSLQMYTTYFSAINRDLNDLSKYTERIDDGHPNNFTGGRLKHGLVKSMLLDYSLDLI